MLKQIVKNIDIVILIISFIFLVLGIDLRELIIVSKLFFSIGFGLMFTAILLSLIRNSF